MQPSARQPSAQQPPVGMLLRSGLLLPSRGWAIRVAWMETTKSTESLTAPVREPEILNELVKEPKTRRKSQYVRDPRPMKHSVFMKDPCYPRSMRGPRSMMDLALGGTQVCEGPTGPLKNPSPTQRLSEETGVRVVE